MARKIHVYADDSFMRRALAEVRRRVLRRRSVHATDFPRRLRRRPGRAEGTVTSDRVNRLLRRRDSCYLEIGVWRGETLEAVLASRRVGVDPSIGIDLRRLPRGVEYRALPSDDFFAQDVESFDAVFVDGLHEARQAYRDIRNSLLRLRPGGFVLVDDVVPPDECASLPSEDAAARCSAQHGLPWRGVWTGDVFRAIRSIATTSRGVDFRTIVARPEEKVQTLMWWNTGDADANERVDCLPPELDEVSAKLEWAAEFRFGVPAWMRPSTRKAAEAAFRGSQDRGPSTSGGSPRAGASSR